MDTKKVLEFIDEAMFAKTEKHLNDLQIKIIEGVLNHQKYADIANSNGKSEGHVKDVGYELLQLLSDIFDEPVRKGNLQSVLERRGNFNFSVVDKSLQSNNAGNNIIGCINLGSDENNSTTKKGKIRKGSKIRNKRIAKIKKLRQKGLTDEEIADILEISLELVESIEQENLGD